MRPLVVTGVGLVSPLGIGFEAFRAALARDDSSVTAPSALGAGPFGAPSQVLDAERIPNPSAAEVVSFDPTPFLGAKGLRNHDRLTLFLLVAARQALADAGLKRDGVHTHYAPERVGVCSATAYGSLDSIHELVASSEQDPRFVNPNRFPNTVINSAGAYVSIWEDLRAPNITVVDGNCSALDALLTTETHLGNDRADAFLVGGGEVLSEPLYLAFRKLGALAEGDRIYRPGSPDSQGMRIGEGAVYFAVEREAEVEKRAGKSYGRIVGYGNIFEPPESEAAIVHASRRAVQRAIDTALTDARLPPQSIDLVCGSLGGLPNFDRAELEAIRAVFGAHVAVAAPKALYGETFGASGALGIASALAWLGGVKAGPCVQGQPPERPRNVLVLAVGFYGNVSAVVVSR